MHDIRDGLELHDLVFELEGLLEEAARVVFEPHQGPVVGLHQSGRFPEHIDLLAHEQVPGRELLTVSPCPNITPRIRMGFR